MELIQKFDLGDMQVRFEKNSETDTVDLSLIPTGMEDKITHDKVYKGDSLVQLKLLSDPYPSGYAGGDTLRYNYSTFQFRYDKQEVVDNKKNKIIKTYLKDERGYEIIHRITYYYGETSIEVQTEFTNKSTEKVTLELLSSFSLGEISPFQKGDAHESLFLHRIRSKWSQEGRVDTISIEDLQLEPNWAYWGINSERFGQVGSMPVKKFAPFMAVEDVKSKVIWGAALAHSASWQMEVFRKDDALHMSGGLADREFGHWMKHIEPGESFATPTALLTVALYDNPLSECNEVVGEESLASGYPIDLVGQRLTNAGIKYVDAGPESEQELPILFNEYCTTWGCPSHENISNIVSNLQGRGLTYFVIDCGWFKPEDAPWDKSMGDYDVSKNLFPEGLEKTVQAIKDAGMKPGLWFEIENVAVKAKAYHYVDHLLKRDGSVLTTDTRRFWDMRDPWVIDYLTEKVINTLNHYGFEYMKIDYNDTIGLGCDGAESLGEGLRQVIEGSIEFFEKVKKEVPGIILENCASGGHRLEPRLMSLMSMASFSDAHETDEIPVIAANLQRIILPRQSQIWAVIRKNDSPKRIAYSLVNTFLGRMCFSGDVTELLKEQWNIIESAIGFYKVVAPIIKDGFSYRYGTKIKSERHLKGWQGVVRVGDNGEAMVVLHTFQGELPDYIKLVLPKDCPTNIAGIYSDTDIDVTINNNILYYKVEDTMKGAVVHLIR